MTNPDLRTLAADAARRVFLARAEAQIEAGPSDHARAIADAVLAAVLPEHRRMVLGEAGKALERARQARIRADGHPIGSGWDEAEWVLDRLAAAAPPAGLSVTVPAENAPAVPEEADGRVDYHPGTPEERARYWKQRAETAWERGDEDGLTIIHLRRERDRLAAQVARVRALHTALDGRCVECVEYCDCLDRVTELGDDVEVAASARMCNHGQEPWPCPTIAAVDALPDAGTDQTEDEKPWPGLPTPGLHLVTVEDMNTCVRCGKFTGRADCPGDTAPEGADERNGHG